MKLQEQLQKHSTDFALESNFKYALRYKIFNDGHKEITGLRPLIDSCVEYVKSNKDKNGDDLLTLMH
jgi:hypothetical protein